MSEYLRTVFDKFELQVRKGFYYTRDDLWVSVENGKVKVGVTDYLQKTSGDVAFIEVAKPGSAVEKGKEFGTMESAKTTVALVSPLSGELEETNSNLTGKPELINSEPYGEGWLVIITPRNLENDRISLLSADDYFKRGYLRLQRRDSNGLIIYVRCRCQN
ncbi:MAG: glycine cleavage system protein H [Candidatus Bathyarchaeia archaeon]